MDISRDIAAMRRRLNKIAPIVSPPELKMHIIQAGMKPPKATSHWEMIVYVEPRVVLS